MSAARGFRWGRRCSVDWCRPGSSYTCLARAQPHVTPINNTDQLAALMRVQIASLRQGGRSSRRPVSNSSTHGLAGNQEKAADAASIAAERLRAIAADDPQREQKALRVFLESVLLAELGSELVSDPAFGAMVDHVVRQLQADPELARAAGEASAMLLNSSQP